MGDASKEKQERRSHADQLLGLLAVGVQNAEQKILKGCKKQGKGKQNHIQGGGESRRAAVSPLNSPPSPAAGRDRMRNSSRNRKENRKCPFISSPCLAGSSL